MPSNENTKSQIKSRQREVNAMLDLVRDESFRLDSRFLEPACGDGNFLIEILRRKLSLLKDIKSPTEWEFQSLIAVGSCYGIELLEDNADACRLRLFTEMREQMGRKGSTQGYEESLRYMLRKNIVCGDALTYRTADGKPITFCEWTPIAGSMQFSRRDFQFDFLVNQTHQYSLFDEQGEAQSFDEPIKSYPPIHYTQLYRYEEKDTHSI